VSSASEPTNRFQEHFGTPKERTRGKLRDHLHPWVQDFIRASPFAVLATSDADGRCDASPRGGTPGFVHVIDERQLLLPDVAGNRLFQSYENVEANPRVALCFFVPGVGEMVRVNGSAQVVDRDELEARGIELSVYWTDDNATQLQGLLIEVEEAYGHCPRAIAFSKLWDGAIIRANAQQRPIPNKPPGV
jgi:PPOX class probable FMN-dependent enzyme